MSLFKISKNRLEKLKSHKFKKEKELQILVESNLEDALGVKFLYSEYPTTHGGIIDTLGLDENNSPVVIEFKKDENQNVINQGLFYMAWLVDHRGDFEILVQKVLGPGITVNWSSPRLILIAGAFNKFDAYAVSRMAGNIELKRYVRYDDDILMIENIQLPGENTAKSPMIRGVKEFDINFHLNKVQDKEALSRIKSLRESIMSFDDNVSEYCTKDHIIFKRSINFCAIYTQKRGFWIDVKLSRGSVNTKGLDIRPHKDKVWTHIRVHPETDLSLLVELAYRAYDENL